MIETSESAASTERGSQEIASILRLAQQYSTCVECFGLIHPSVDWDRPQTILLTKLGIQQARLLAWGDNLGITESDARRDPRLDALEYRSKVEDFLQNIIDRPAHVHRTTQFEKYGLKPPKKFTSAYRPALDVARLEGFREKFEALNQERWEVRRGMSVTANHWTIVDAKRFAAFVALIRENVDALVTLMQNGDYVDRALKSDIKALGWHPIFDKGRAASDSSKLRYIREACAEDYPEYAATTAGALAYIDKEWHENHMAAMDKYRNQDSLGHNSEEGYGGDGGSEIPGAASRLMREAAAAKAAQKANNDKANGGRRSSLFGFFKRKPSARDTHAAQQESNESDPKRSMSLAEPSTQPPTSVLTPPMTPEQERSKSMSHFPMTPESLPADQKDGCDLAQVETRRSLQGAMMEPATSMISRHDQWRPV